MIKGILSQFLWPEIGVAILSLIPIFIAATFLHDLSFLKLGLITISIFISINRLKYSITIMIIHFLMILLFFSIFYLSLNKSILLFSFLCALTAFSCIWLTLFGDKLRTVGNFIFIPSMYLACEIRRNLPLHTNWLTPYIQFMEQTPIVLCSIAILFLFYYKNKIKFFPERGKPVYNWLQPGVAIFTGVFISALLAFIFHLDNPEWFIWSCASVITIELEDSRKKFFHRFFGAIIGMIIGLCIGFTLPKNELVYSFAVLGIMLTLTSFKNYFVSFIARCCFIMIAAYAISSSLRTAAVRIENVFLGGLIGIFIFHVVTYLFYKYKSVNINFKGLDK